MNIKTIDFQIGKMYKIHSIEKCFRICGMIAHSKFGFVYVGEDAEDFHIFTVPASIVDDGDIEEL